MPKKIIILFIAISTLVLHTERVFAFTEPTEITLKIKDRQETIKKETLLEWINYNPTLKYQFDYHSEIENVKYCQTSLIVCAITKRKIDGHRIKKEERAELNDNSIKETLEEIAKKVNQEAKNATFSIKNQKVEAFSIEQEGFEIDIEKSVEKIKSEIQNNSSEEIELELPHNTISPDVTAKDVNKLGIVEVIGEGKSNFSGSTSSRIYNIKVATSRFDGLMIAPGEEFSFVKNLGPVDGEHGYKQELVIKKDKTELDFGGGVCQVSTTMFRAAIYSGLEVTERRNHAYPVSYYNPQGMDSTIYVPKPDLKFINNTNNYILIQSEVNVPARELIFRFYGTKNGRNVEIDGPHVTSREADGSMKTVFTQTVKNSEGEVILNDTFKSSYDSPNNYPHPGQEQKLTAKPDDWSKKEWKEYKKANGI